MLGCRPNSLSTAFWICLGLLFVPYLCCLGRVGRWSTNFRFKQVRQPPSVNQSLFPSFSQSFHNLSRTSSPKWNKNLKKKSYLFFFFLFFFSDFYGFFVWFSAFFESRCERDPYLFVVFLPIKAFFYLYRHRKKSKKKLQKWPPLNVYCFYFLKFAFFLFLWFVSLLKKKMRCIPKWNYFSDMLAAMKGTIRINAGNATGLARLCRRGGWWCEVRYTVQIKKAKDKGKAAAKINDYIFFNICIEKGDGVY